LNNSVNNLKGNRLAIWIPAVYLLLVAFSFFGIPTNEPGGGAWIPILTFVLTLPWIAMFGYAIPSSVASLYIAFVVSAIINAAILYRLCRMPRNAGRV